MTDVHDPRSESLPNPRPAAESPNGAAVAGHATAEMAVVSWARRRRLRAGAYEPGALRTAKRGHSTTVIIPTRECAETIPRVLELTVRPWRELGLVDEVVVVDAASHDGTAAIAHAHGARVVQQDEVLTEYGRAVGKGDAMWRALYATSGDIVCFLDGDTLDPTPDHLLGLLGPLLSDPTIALVKGAFARPLEAGSDRLPHEGGRVTELMARPLLNLHEPRLAGFSQPLAGEFGGRRDLLEAISFPAGYGVEIAVMIDALRLRGLDALAECNLGTRQNRHQSLRALGEMAYAVLSAVERRLGERAAAPNGRYLRPWDDLAAIDVPIAERPPLCTFASRDIHGSGNGYAKGEPQAPSNSQAPTDAHDASEGPSAADAAEPAQSQTLERR